MKEKICCLIITFMAMYGVNKALAQQDAMYSQYMFNSLAINPAYAGSRNVLSATALFRSQWTGIAGAPKTGTFTIDAPIDEKRIGLGLQVFSDKLGITSTTGAVASYAYRIRMEKGTLSFGLQVSGSQYKANYASVVLDPENAGNDPAFSTNANKFLLNFGTGIYYNSDRFYIGLSAPELLTNKLHNNITELENDPVAKQAIHLFFAAGYVFPLSDEFKLKPSVLFKGVKGAPLEGDFNATLWIKDVIAVGAQYRTNADVSGLLELQLSPQIRLGYAYDHSITPLRNYNSGGHEIMLRYEFGFEGIKILSPRYF
ncbi:MAG: type IX secretion system membrane protein PorP/SprF [Sphingobacteriaceae bacterium]